MGAAGSVTKDTLRTDLGGLDYLYLTTNEKKRKMVFYYNTAWPMYALDSGER